jgi:hypothetical protein
LIKLLFRFSWGGAVEGGIIDLAILLFILIAALFKAALFILLIL